MAKKLEDIQQYLISGSCMICRQYKGNDGQCEGKVNSKGCLGFSNIRGNEDDKN